MNLKMIRDGFFSKKSAPVTFALTNPGTFWQMLGGVEYALKYGNAAQYQIAYETCPSLTAIIGKLARFHTTGVVTIQDLEGNINTGPLAKSILEFIERPNPVQTWDQFYIQHMVHRLVFGNAYIFKLSPVGMSGTISALWNLPPPNVQVMETQKSIMETELSGLIDYVRFTYGANSVTFGTKSNQIPLENLLIVKDDTANFQSMVLADSRIRSLSYPVQVISAAYEAMYVLEKKRGGVGILSNTGKDQTGHVPMLPAEKSRVQTELSKYGLSDALQQIIVTDAALNWTPMVFNTKDLLLFEGVEEATRAICDAYDFPMYLMGFKAGSTFNNVAEAKKSVYTDNVIPSAVDFYKNMSRFLGLTAAGLQFSVDFTHLDIFQQSEKEKAEGRKAMDDACKLEYDNGLITLNQWLIEIGLEAIGPEGDKRKDMAPKPEPLPVPGEMPEQLNNEENGTQIPE